MLTIDSFLSSSPSNIHLEIPDYSAHLWINTTIAVGFILQGTTEKKSCTMFFVKIRRVSFRLYKSWVGRLSSLTLNVGTCYPHQIMFIIV